MREAFSSVQVLNASSELGRWVVTCQNFSMKYHIAVDRVFAEPTSLISTKLGQPVLIEA